MQTWYDRSIKAIAERGRFLKLLGMGDYGRTASLLPGQPAVTVRVRWVMAQYYE